jgi:hypothetical protein
MIFDIDTLADLINWLDSHRGTVQAIIALITLIGGWASGIFTALRHKPKFNIEMIGQPSFCCNFVTGEQRDGFEVHRTSIALYLTVSNIGFSPSDIKDISVGYKSMLRFYDLARINKSLDRYWLKPCIVRNDFYIEIQDDIKVFPFLIQNNVLVNLKSETYLNIGQSTNGIVYFEQSDSFGINRPKIHNNTVDLKIKVADVFGGKHYAKFKVPHVSLEEARKYNPSFGKTYPNEEKKL